MNESGIEPPPPYVFLSYVADDRAFAVRLADALRRQGIATWTDVADIAAGENWQQAVARALRGAAALIHVSSRHSDGSKLLGDQLGTFMGGNGLVVPVVVDDEGAAAVPLALRDVRRVDARGGLDQAVQELAQALAPLRRARPLPLPAARASGYVFISYAAEDAPFVARLKAFMKARGYAYWDFLESDRDYQADYTHELEVVIKGARATVSVVSPAWKQSRTALQELHFSWEAGTPVFLLEVEDPGPTLVLAGRTVIDFTTSIDAGFERLDAELARQGLPSSVAGAAAPAGADLRHQRGAPGSRPWAGARRWLLGAGTAGVLLAASSAVWFASRSPASVPEPATHRSAPAPAATRRPSREAVVPVAWAVVEGGSDCPSRPDDRRVAYRGESLGPWPAGDEPRGRDIQVVASEGVTIDWANVVMHGGLEAATVSQPRREVVRKWTFGQPVAVPVVIVVCARTALDPPPEAPFRVTTWKDVT